MAPSPFEFFDRVRGETLQETTGKGLRGLVLAIFFLVISGLQQIQETFSAPLIELGEGIADLVFSVFGGGAIVIFSGVQEAARSIAEVPFEQLGPFAFPLQILVAAIGIWIAVRALSFIFPFSLVDLLGFGVSEEEELGED